MSKVFKIAALTIGCIITLCAVINMTEKKDSKNDSSSSAEDSIADVLAEKGIDTDKIQGKSSTSSGGTILGSALPAVQYKTLNDAEKSFGYYLGLHNKLESLSDYELVDMYIINKQVMQAVYENSNSTKTITVKTSKTETASDLADVYSNDKVNDQIEVNGVDINISVSNDVIKLAYFSVPNGKSYSVYTAAGLNTDDMTSILTELIENLKLMEDWES